MKAVVAAFNQEKALVGAFSVIVQPVAEPMEHYTALIERGHLERLELMLEVLRVLWCRESPSCTTFRPEMLNWRSRYRRSPLQSTHQPLTQLDI